MLKMPFFLLILQSLAELPRVLEMPVAQWPGRLGEAIGEVSPEVCG